MRTSTASPCARCTTSLSCVRPSDGAVTVTTGIVISVIVSIAVLVRPGAGDARVSLVEVCDRGARLAVPAAG